jgi:hypothetical protein
MKSAKSASDAVMRSPLFEESIIAVLVAVSSIQSVLQLSRVNDLVSRDRCEYARLASMLSVDVRIVVDLNLRMNLPSQHFFSLSKQNMKHLSKPKLRALAMSRRP